jgi:hypothetical protein
LIYFSIAMPSFPPSTARHIVLAVRIEGKWGALGLSRKSTLEHKPLEFSSLAALIADYRTEYERLHHTIRRFSVGLPITLDDHSTEHAFWTCLLCPVWSEADWLRAAQVVEAFVRDAERMLESVRAGLVLRPIENTVLLDEASSVGTGEGLGRRICMIAPSHPHHHERQQQLDRAAAKASRRQLVASAPAAAEPMSPGGGSGRSRDRSRGVGRALSLVGKSANGLPQSVHSNDSESSGSIAAPSSSDVGGVRSRMMLGV